MQDLDYKLLFNPSGLICDGEPVPERVELYNVVADPSETDNLAADSRYLVLVSNLRAHGASWWSSLPVTPCDEHAGQAYYRWP